jgi:Fe-S-cluster containining protein
MDHPMVDVTEDRAQIQSTHVTAVNGHPTDVDAGDFGQWVRSMTASLQGESGNDVPCGDCVGCCSSSWPIALRPSDARVVAHIPVEWLIDPDNAPHGLRYMGYRDDGTCPMLQSGRCSVYVDRPQTCRDFDCRLFAAAGILSAGDNKPLINARIGKWRFTYATPADEAVHQAMRTATAFLNHPATRALAPRLPTSPIALAGLAFKAHGVFLDPAHETWAIADCLQQVIAAARSFDQA